MFKNYLITAARNLFRNKAFAAINVLGLSIGIAASVVIFLVVRYDFSFDRFEKDSNRIFRVVSDMHFPDQDFKLSGVCGPLPLRMRGEMPEIENSTLFWNKEETKVTRLGLDEKPSVFQRQKKIIFTDLHYFEFIPYPWLAGSPISALDRPNQVVLTESRARIYFPDQDLSQVVGQTLVYDDSIKVKVTGIVKDLEQNTDFTFKEFISFPTYLSRLKNEHDYDSWGSVSSSLQFFVKLSPSEKPADIEKKMADIRSKNVQNQYLKTTNYLQPLTDIHFNASYDNFGQRRASKPTLYGLLAVAGFLLLLGCINFINLATAQATQRAKEIGIRKTMGGSKAQLMLQFMMETGLLTLLAGVLSVILAPFILRFFSGFIAPEIKFNIMGDPQIIFFLIGLLLVVTLLAGTYPSIILARYNPALVLKNLGANRFGPGGKVWLRKTLTVTQFAIAQFFIIAALVVAKQISYSLHLEMGFRKDAIINFQTPYNFANPDRKQFILLEKLKSIPGIEQISLAGPPPASTNRTISTLSFHRDEKDIETSVEMKDADTSYIQLYQLKLLAGRNLRQSDTVSEFLVNLSCLKALGYSHPEDIVGKFTGKGTQKEIQIVGVIDDFHSKSTHELITPLVLTCEAQHHHFFHVALKTKGQNTQGWRSTISQIEKAWKEIYPSDNFSYDFFDQSIAQFYTQDQDLSQLLNFSTALAILISCLGLLGLVMYSTARRTREIGVRKVLGASLSQIVALLSKEFLFLVLLAFLLAAPLAWWMARRWLSDFSYQTPVSWWLFPLSALLLLVFALIALSFQTLRAAMANPVKSLRTE
jgi:putative ABC transport system permease protein